MFKFIDSRADIQCLTIGHTFSINLRMRLSHLVMCVMLIVLPGELGIYSYLKLSHEGLSKSVTLHLFFLDSIVPGTFPQTIEM